MGEDEGRHPILTRRDVVKIVNGQEQVDVVNLFPTLKPGDVLKISKVTDLGDLDLGQLIALHEVEQGEGALSVSSGAGTEEAVRSAGVVGARVTSIDHNAVSVEVTDSADAAGE